MCSLWLIIMDPVIITLNTNNAFFSSLVVVFYKGCGWEQPVVQLFYMRMRNFNSSIWPTDSVDY